MIHACLVAGDSECPFQGPLPSGFLLFNEMVVAAIETPLFPRLSPAYPLPQPFRALQQLTLLSKDGTTLGPPWRSADVSSGLAAWQARKWLGRAQGSLS